MEDFALSQLQLNRQLDNAQDLIELALRRSRMIADNMPALVAYIDAGQRYQFLNSQYLYTHGIDHEKMIGSTILEVFGPVYYAAIEKEVERALNGETLVFERETSCSGDKSLCLRYQYSPDINQDGVVMGFYSLVSDVTDMKAVQTQLLALSKIDALTGLPNRTALRERLDDAMARVFRRNHGTAKTELIGCLFLDIDSFKLINDRYGHICGDEVLKEFASRLEVCIRKTDMVARLAGDEFVILLEKLENSEDAVLVANKIINMMSAPFVSENCQLFVTVSIGITVGSDMNETTDSFLKKADDKLYIAKKNGKNTYAI